jgi:phosphoglycolate phosphatase
MGSHTQIAIFDLDGTLVDSVKQIAVNLNKARLDFGFPAQPLTFYQDLVGLPVSELLSDIELSEEDFTDLVKHFRSYLVRNIQQGQNLVFAGVLDTFKLFASMRVGLAVATSKPTKVAIEVVKYSPLGEFDIYVQGTDDFPPKPDPEVILRVLSHFRATPSFMVGDRMEDIYAARAADIPAIGIASSAHSEANLMDAGATFTFKTFEGFYQRLKSDVTLIPNLSRP